MIKVLIFFLTMFEMAMAENPQPLDFEFISDKGSRIVLSKIISEKKVLASIFYTSCKTICPLTVQKLKASTQNLAGTSPPAVVMFTIDPKTDTSKRLMEFRGAHKIPNDWILLSGKGDGYLEALRALGFHFSSVESGAHAMHSVNIIMINPDGSTRSVSNKLQSRTRGGKLIVCGNKEYGLAGAIYNRHPDAVFASRSSGWDFVKYEDIERFAEQSLQHTILIGCSALSRFRQTLLLESVIKKWNANNHHGRIIMIGSSADAPVKGTDWIYPIEKKALKAYCRNLGSYCAGSKNQPAKNFRVTYLSVGNLETPKTNIKYPEQKKLNLDYVASVIDWICEQPLSVNINEISIDPVQ